MGSPGPRVFWVLESRKNGSEESSLPCPEQWPDQETHPFTVLGGSLRRQAATLLLGPTYFQSSTPPLRVTLRLRMLQ